MTPKGIVYYVLTFVLELIPAFGRWALGTALVWVISKIPVVVSLVRTFGSPTWVTGTLDNPDILRQSYYLWQIGQPFVWAFVLYPFVLSVSALLVRRTGFLSNRLAVGARTPSGREQTRIEEAFSNLRATSLPKPSHIYVIDNSKLGASSLGTTLYLTRELVSSPHLEPVIARELGHIASRDARLQLALRSLSISWLHVLPVVGADFAGAAVSSALRGHGLVSAGIAGVTAINWLTFLSRGGLGVALLRPLWAGYWQAREFEADKFAAAYGQAQGLVEYLERYESFDIAVPYFIADKPYTEQRIERLLGYIKDPTLLPSQPIPTTTLTLPRRLPRAAVVGAGALVLVGGAWVAFGGGGRALGGSSLDGSWHLVGFCRGAQCTPDGPPFEWTVVASFNPPDTPKNTMQMFSTHPAGTTGQFEGTFTHLGDTLNLELRSGDGSGPAINLYPEYQVELEGDALLLRTPREAYLWRRDEVYQEQLRQFARYWRNTATGDAYVITGNAVVFRNEVYIGFITVLDGRRISFDIEKGNSREIYEYTVNGASITLKGIDGGTTLDGVYECTQRCE